MWQTKRKEIIVGALLAIVAVCLGAWLVKTYIDGRPSAPPTAAITSTIATLDLTKVTESHKSYTRLGELRAELTELQAEVANILPESAPQAPQAMDQPFDESVWQKNAQAAIGEAAEILRYKKEITAQYIKETEADYLVQRNEINERYLNAILNLRLKIDNSEALGISKQKVEEMEALIVALQRERGEFQRELEEKHQAEINERVDAVIKERFGDWKQRMNALKAEREAAAARAQAEAQNRNARMMEDQLNIVNVRNYLLKVAQKREEIAQKEQEIYSLESHIFNDVASQAAKLAIMHHFTLIISNPATNLEYLVPWANRVGAPPEQYGRVVGVQTADLTDDIIREINNAQ